MPDKIAVHTYERESDSHRSNAIRALEEAEKQIGGALSLIRQGPSPSLTYHGRQAVAYSAEAWAHLQAYLALHSVRFLVEDEAPNSA